MHIRSRVLAVSGALVVSAFLASAAGVGAQDKKAPAKPDKALQAEIDAVVKIADDALAGLPTPTDVPFTWQYHLLKSANGKAYVPFVLSFEREKAPPAVATVYVRAVNKAAADEFAKGMAAKAAADKSEKAAQLDPENVELAEMAERAKAAVPVVEYPFHDLKVVEFKNPDPVQPFRLPRALGVAAGDYDVYIVVKENQANVKGKKPPARTGVLKVSLSVPNFWAEELMTSSFIVTSKAETLPTPPTPAQIANNPYIFGNLRITPSPTGKFVKSEDLTIWFQVYNATLDKATGKPDVVIDYNFYHKAGGAEKFFNKAVPVQMNGKTLPPNFDPAVHPLPGDITLPLASFPEGEYRLEIKIKDNVSGKTKTENVGFTVAAS
jgi:hypothetical protein